MTVCTKEWLLAKFKHKKGIWKACYYGHNAYIMDYGNVSLDYLVEVAQGKKKVSRLTHFC